MEYPRKTFAHKQAQAGKQAFKRLFHWHSHIKNDNNDGVITKLRTQCMTTNKKNNSRKKSLKQGKQEGTIEERR